MELTFASYATTGNLAAYLGVAEGTLTDNDTRLLQRASRLVFAATYGRYAIAEPEDDAEEPYPSLVEATCAQVEYWRTNGESADTTPGIAAETVGKHSVTYTNGGNAQRLAPRAFDVLQGSGALYAGMEAR